LDAGHIPDAAAIGSGFGAAAPRSDHRLTGLTAASLSYRSVGSGGDFGSVALTPFGGPLPPRPLGRLGMYGVLDRGRWRVDIFSEARKDSMLSFVGLTDPGSGVRWGQVIENGTEGRGSLKVGSGWTLSGHVRLAHLSGYNVAKNARLSLSVGGAYDVPVGGFRYVTVGPRYAFDHFRRNLEGFTFGQGGYFSPDRLHRFSLAADFETVRGRDYLLRGSVSAGWQIMRTASRRLYPLSGQGDRIPGEKRTGMTAGLRLSGVYRVAGGLFVGARARADTAPGNRSYGGDFFLKWSFGSRHAALATDLPGKEP
jgi:hypothetical protein